MGWLESRVGRFERRPGKTTWGLAGRGFGGSGEQDPQNMCLWGAHQLCLGEVGGLGVASREIGDHPPLLKFELLLWIAKR